MRLSHDFLDYPISEWRPANDRDFRRPAAGFWHDGELNMGPATWLAVTLSLLSWAGIIGTGYIIHPFF